MFEEKKKKHRLAKDSRDDFEEDLDRYLERRERWWLKRWLGFRGQHRMKCEKV